MGLKIVTGRTGTSHVTSNQIQAFNRSLLGDLAILDVGQHFDAVVRDANTVRIYDGCIVVQGIYAIIPHDEFEDILVEPVSVGNTRIDTIYLHYTKDMESDTESVEIDIAQGEEAVNNPVKPDIDAGGDTWEGTTDIRIPLYDVTVTSFETTITAYEYMDVYSPNINDLNQRIPETTVSGVKGDAESEYRGGNVNITPANIGLGNVDNTSDTDKPVSTAQQSALDTKVDKVTGKGLSTNDYTNEEKQKLANIESNAQANVQSDWNEDDTEDDGYIKNKPNLDTSLTATGNPLTIESSESNLVECVAEVEAVQEGSGDPSPDNIRPIIGQTEVVIEDVGKNLLPMTVEEIKALNTEGSWSGNSYTYYGVTYTIITDNDGNVTGISTNGTVSSSIWASAFALPNLYVTNGELYIITGCPSGGSGSTYVLYTTNNKSDNVMDHGNGRQYSATFTGYAYVRMAIYRGVTVNNLVFKPMIRLASEADSSFEPYKGKTYTIQLGDTIYGGELDVITGGLRVTHGEVDLGTLTWVKGDSSGITYFAATVAGKAYGLDNLICSHYPVDTSGVVNMADKSISGVSNNRDVRIKDSSYSDTTTLKTALDGVKVVYKLATPYTIQLTPQQLRMLKGTNNISCNTGDLSIKYYPDNVLGQLKGDIEKGLNAYYDYQIQALWDKINELQA